MNLYKIQIIKENFQENEIYTNIKSYLDVVVKRKNTFLAQTCLARDVGFIRKDNKQNLTQWKK